MNLNKKTIFSNINKNWNSKLEFQIVQLNLETRNLWELYLYMSANNIHLQVRTGSSNLNARKKVCKSLKILFKIIGKLCLYVIRQ